MPIYAYSCTYFFNSLLHFRMITAFIYLSLSNEEEKRRHIQTKTKTKTKKKNSPTQANEWGDDED